MASSYIQY